MNNEMPWWFPELCDVNFFTKLRNDYPENAWMTNEELHEYYADSKKYATTWDTLNDAYADYEKLADAYFELLSKQKELSDE